MPQKTSWFSQYTLDYPNRDPDKISFYVVGWISIALLGMCMMFANIPAGVLLIVFFGLILTLSTNFFSESDQTSGCRHSYCRESAGGRFSRGHWNWFSEE